ncbi:MAG: response regulator [Kiritimatiellae bacterium]|jgi:PAS domain S-box-containing protein|nr:response regulator [Kiritimatiellia bacterium]
MNTEGVILLLDNNQDIQSHIAELIKQLQSAVPPLVTVETRTEADEVLTHKNVIACYSTYRMGEDMGVEFIREMSPRYPGIPFLLLSGEKENELEQLAMQAGAKDYLTKSELTVESFLKSLRYAINQTRKESMIRNQERLVNTTQDELMLLREVILQVEDVVLITDNTINTPGGPAILYVNPAFSKMTGYSREEVIGKSPKILQGPKTDKAILRNLKDQLSAGNDFHAEAVNYRKDGSEYRVNWSITPVVDAYGKVRYFASIQRDVTEEYNRRQQEQRNQRLESLGNLVGGISHDLNNILSTNMMGAGMLEQAETVDMRRSIGKSIMDSTQRAADVVGKLLTFARGRDSEKNNITLDKVLNEIYKIAKETFPRELNIQLKLPENLWVTRCCATEIQQVLLNLVINAKDSMDGIKNGRLTVSATNVTLDQKGSREAGLPVPGDFVQVDVTDNGTGIPTEILNQIFDPFFTTKEEEKGTGLGLSSSLRIIKSHKGTIKVLSEQRSGSTFRVYLPAEPSRLPDVEKVDKDFLHGLGERILVVDDEPTISNLVCEMLEQFGYPSKGLSSAVEALKLFSAQPDNFDMIISDVMMPGINGIDLSKEIRKLKPDIPILIMTGYVHHDEVDGLADANLHQVISKPIRLELLMQKLNEMLPRKE